MQEKMINTKDAMKYLEISRSRLYKLVYEEKLKVYKRQDNIKLSYFSLAELNRVKQDFEIFMPSAPQSKILLEHNNLQNEYDQEQAFLNPEQGPKFEAEFNPTRLDSQEFDTVSMTKSWVAGNFEVSRTNETAVGDTTTAEWHYPTESEGDFFDQLLSQKVPLENFKSLAALGRVQRLAEFIDLRFENMIAPYGLKQHEYLVLATIKRSGPPYSLTPTEIYKSLAIPSGSVTKRIDQLESLGMVERKPDPNDRRGVKISMTPKGMKLLSMAEKQPNELYNHMVKSLSQAELTTFINLLRKLLRDQEQELPNVLKI